MLNYNHLHYFHIVASEGTVAAAAQRLGLTQPTVSEQIRSLERELGVTLFERSTTGLTLTEAGRAAFEQTSVMFRASERLVEVIHDDRRAIPASLRVGISTAVSRSTATDFLLPLLTLENCVPVIRTGDWLQLMRDARAGELDLVLMETEPSNALRRGLDVALVGRTQLVAVAAPSVKPSETWDNVALIHYRVSAPVRWEVEAFLQARHLRPKIAAEADDAAFLVEAAERSGCIAIVPRPVVRDSLSAGRLVVVAEIEPSQAAVYAAYQETATVDLARRAVQILIAHLRMAEIK